MTCDIARMEWNDVRALSALLRSANLHTAARRLGVDRSTISRRLSALERSLAAPLFIRTRDGIKPTGIAERLRPHVEQMEAHATRLAHAAAATDAGASGLVRVATTEALGRLLVTEGLLDLREQHPELVIEILGGNKPLDLVRGEADLALRLTPVRQPDLRVRCLARMGIGLYASPAYLARRGRVRGPGSLAGHDVIVPAGELAALPEARWLAARKGVRVVFRTSSMPALIAAATAGVGLAPIGLPWGTAVSGLERALVLDQLPKRPVWLVTEPGALARAAVRVVRDRVAVIVKRAFEPDRAGV